MNTTYKISFDGCGLNDANDKYKKRLFTMRPEDRDGLKDYGQYIERAVNSHDTLVEALENLLREPMAERTVDKARKALTLAKKGT